MKIPPGKSAFLVCGEDDWRVEQSVRELLDALVPPGNREFGLEIVDGRVDTVGDMTRAFRAVRDALSADGLFGGGEKTVWFREPAFLASDSEGKENRVAKSEETKENAAKLLAMVKDGLPEGSKLVVSTLKINRGQAFFKTFASTGVVVDLGSGFKEKDLRERAELLLAEMLPKMGLEMDAAARAAFLARAGTKSRAIISELEKLSAYCGKGKKATAADVAEVTSADSTSEIWDVTDAFAARDAKLFISLLEQHYNRGENAIFMVQMLLAQVGNLLMLRDGIAQGWARTGFRGASWEGVPEDLARAFDMAEKDPRKAYIGGRAAKNAERWTVAELRAARHYILTLREELVSRQLPELFMLETRLLQAMGAIKQS